MPYKNKADAAAYQKRYYDNNKEKVNAQKALYYKNNKEHLDAKRREWREKNKEKCKIVAKRWRDNNKEKIKKYKAEYDRTPAGKKSTRISAWKCRGLIHDNYSELYDKYLATTQCDVCDYKFLSSKDRCMDHDHETGLFRQFLCHSCNSHDSWKKIISSKIYAADNNLQQEGEQEE